MIIPDGDIIVTSLTLNGCVSLWHRATPVAKPTGPAFCFIASRRSSRANTLKSVFLSFTVNYARRLRGPLINSAHPSPRMAGKRKKKNRNGEKPLTVPPRYFLSNLDIPRFFSSRFSDCSPISNFVEYEF